MMGLKVTQELILFTLCASGLVAHGQTSQRRLAFLPVSGGSVLGQRAVTVRSQIRLQQPAAAEDGVVVYATPGCEYCDRAARLLQARGVSTKTIDVSGSIELREEMSKMSGGVGTVPQIFVAGVHLGGCEDLEREEREGRLEALLRESGLEVSNSGAIQLKEPSRTTNQVLGLASILLATAFYFFQMASLNPLTILHEMEAHSVPLDVAATNGRPTLIEFYADRCEDCREMAPTMLELELTYQNKVNFIVLNGLAPENQRLVSAFGVDAIPHMAFMDDHGKYQTTLVGLIPKQVVAADLDALLTDNPLPFTNGGL